MNDSRNRPRPPEFSQTLGDQQRGGDPRVLGLGPPPEPSVIGIAPPSPLQVQSIFDTRPIGAFDFAFEVQLQFNNETPFATGSVEVPDGFTAVLRRVELESLIGLFAPFDGSIGLALLRSDAVIPYNQVSFPSAFTSYTWKTHHVFGFWETFGVRIGGSPPATAGTLSFLARFFGTLIPSRSLPPSDEVGSDPVLIREFQPISGGSK